MLSLITDKELQRICRANLIVITDNIHRAAERVSQNQIAWGQYLDYEQATQQTGIYGTATAVKTLAMLGDLDTSDYLQGGINWLSNSLTDITSRANQKQDWAIIYKYCYFLEVLNTHGEEVNEGDESSGKFRDLLDRKLPDDGWGEYYLTDENKDSNSSIIATGIALYVLRRYAPFSGSTSGRDSCLRFCQKVIARTDSKVISVALAVFAVSQYLTKHPNLKSSLDELTTILQRKTKTELKGFHLSNYFHNFTVSDNITGQSTNKYIFLPVNVLVSLAFITGNKYKKNRNYVRQSILLYQQSISDNNGYVSPDSQRKSTIDQYWITLLFKEFLTLNPLGFWESLWLRITRRRFGYYTIITLASLIVLLAVYWILQLFGQDTKWTALSAIVVLVAGIIISRIWESKRRDSN